MRISSLAFAVFLISAPLAAQNTDIEALSGLPFQFGNPGARALGMGGAFLGLADDASAAEANPAGLTILRRPEVTIEGRNWLTIQELSVGGTFPDIEQRGFNAYSRRADVTFASAVIPLGNFAIAGYYHVPLRYENSLENIFQGNDPIDFYLGPQGVVTLDQCIALGNDCDGYQLFPFFTQVEIDLRTMGLAAAWRMGNLSLGVAARHQELKQTAFTFRTSIPDNFGNVFLTSLSGQLVDDTDLTWSGGFKWTASERLSFGGVYKQGATFDAPLYFQDFTSGSPLQLVATPTFNTPDIYGVGISFRPTPVLTINADAVNVAYSNLSSNLVSIFTDINPATDYEQPDVIEYRVGAEYFFQTAIPFAIRAGWWREPAHALRAVGAMNHPERVASRIIFPGGRDQNHYSVGVGLAWPRISIDAAYDTSDTFKVGSISMVTRF
jgi:long-chain fatty acid transport protein